jgi:hypothetical protein
MRAQAKHGERGLRHHRHIDDDAVALFDAQRFECVGEAADFALHLAVGDFPVIAWLVAFPDQATVSFFAGKWRSTQLKHAFRIPSSYHLMETGALKDVFLILVGSLIQVRRFAMAPQNLSGSFTDCAYMSRYSPSEIAARFQRILRWRKNFGHREY